MVILMVFLKWRKLRVLKTLGKQSGFDCHSVLHDSRSVLQLSFRHLPFSSENPQISQQIRTFGLKTLPLASAGFRALPAFSDGNSDGSLLMR
jgi:hypothetical protein